jgi:hypothetical protein
MATRALTVLLACACVLGAAAPATAEMADAPWPPRTGPGQLYAHFGEEHYNDADGGTLLPKVVHRFDEAGVAYLAGAGNHDRKAPPGAPGGTVGLFFLTTPDTFDNYKAVFAARPYPMGDGAPYQAPAHPAFAPLVRPADDPAGAAATYAVDVGTTRWIFLDNSCWSLTGCDPFQARADGGTGSQLAFLREKAQQATDAGRTVFVVMHIPTKDPRDQSYTDLTARNHVMGKGVTTDNGEFESIAAATGVDAVVVGHIKGQFR